MVSPVLTTQPVTFSAVQLLSVNRVAVYSNSDLCVHRKSYYTKEVI